MLSSDGSHNYIPSLGVWRPVVGPEPTKPLTWDDLFAGLQFMRERGTKPYELRVERDKGGRWVSVSVREVEPTDPRVSQRLLAVGVVGGEGGYGSGGGDGSGGGGGHASV